MLSFPSELTDSVEQLRAKLVAINGSEQTCMTNALTSASQGNLPAVQAIIARCRQRSAAAAATAIDIFRAKCSALGTHASSSTKAAIIAATAARVSDFWAKSESLAAALASEAASQLPAQGPDETMQAINTIYSDRASSINRYFGSGRCRDAGEVVGGGDDGGEGEPAVAVAREGSTPAGRERSGSTARPRWPARRRPRQTGAGRRKRNGQRL
jgi:hypothetical protein